MTDPENHEPEQDRPDRDAAARDADWTEETYPLVDADFVGDTLDRVLTDRDEIKQEAAQVDAFQFDPRDLAMYDVPPVTDDFVERTLDRVLTEREADRRMRSAEDHELHSLLENAVVPEPTPDFVDRTLDLVMSDRARTRVHRPRFARPFSLAAAAAAVILCGVAIFWGRWNVPELDAERTVGTPVAWAALVRTTDRPMENVDLGLRFEAPQDIELFIEDLAEDDK